MVTTQQVKKNEWVRFASSIVTTIRRVNTTTSSRISNRTKRARMMPAANATRGTTRGFFTGVPYCVPHKDCDENGFDPAAVEVVARTGYGEAVRVFDLGPRNERISGMSWRSHRQENP